MHFNSRCNEITGIWAEHFCPKSKIRTLDAYHGGSAQRIIVPDVYPGNTEH